jgi:F-type H+-transporting ATPase subunit beta
MKVVDLLAPYQRGGKIGLFGGAGRRQDRHHPRAHQQRREAARRRVGVRGRRRAHARGNDLYLEMQESKLQDGNPSSRRRRSCSAR